MIAVAGKKSLLRKINSTSSSEAPLLGMCQSARNDNESNPSCHPVGGQSLLIGRDMNSSHGLVGVVGGAREMQVPTKSRFCCIGQHMPVRSWSRRVDSLGDHPRPAYGYESSCQRGPTWRPVDKPVCLASLSSPELLSVILESLHELWGLDTR
jgi:hypothetical protein